MIKRHQFEYKRLDDRIRVMCVDQSDGVVDAAFCDKMSNQWREEKFCCRREIGDSVSCKNGDWTPRPGV